MILCLHITAAFVLCLLLITVRSRSFTDSPRVYLETEQNDYLRVQEKIAKFNDLVHQTEQLNKADEEILYSEEQVDFLLSNIENGRLKRDIRVRPSTQWVSIPIKWKFQGSHSLSQQKIVKEAFNNWQTMTCIQFEQLSKSQKYDDHHLVITKNYNKCSTYIGRMSMNEQPLNLGDKCFKEFGTILHEIGHALGFWHDQQRLDRDDYVRIRRGSLKFNKGQFIRRQTLMNLPYDFNSVMHYNSLSGGFGDIVTETIDPLFQKNIGQRVTLSYLNIKAINLRYCADKCSIELLCENGGYTDPRNCSICICPQMFSGKLCQAIAVNNGKCGGHLKVTDQFKILVSPGYVDDGYYPNHSECAWLMTTENPEDKIKIEFIDEFGIYDHDAKQCYHWLEIFTKDQFDIPGYRVCGYEKPTLTFTSKASRLGLIFKSLFDTIWTSSRRGFKIRYSIENVIGKKSNLTDNDDSSNEIDTSDEVKNSKENAVSNCNGVDLTFLLDSSGSVGEKNWKESINFVNSFSIKESSMRTSVISFGNKADVLFKLNYLNKRKDLVQLLRNSTWKDQYTNTRDALIVARTIVFKQANNKRIKRVILITNGEANIDENMIFLPALLLRLAGVKVYVVAVGRHASYSQAVAISGSKNKVLTLWNYSQLPEKMSRIKEMACE